MHNGGTDKQKQKGSRHWISTKEGDADDAMVCAGGALGGYVTRAEPVRRVRAGLKRDARAAAAAHAQTDDPAARVSQTSSVAIARLELQRTRTREQRARARAAIVRYCNFHDVICICLRIRMFNILNTIQPCSVLLLQHVSLPCSCSSVAPQGAHNVIKSLTLYIAKFQVS